MATKGLGGVLDGVRRTVARACDGLVERLPLRPSARLFWREGRRSGQSLWEMVHGYVYGRWPHGYIGSAIGERWQKRLLLPLFAPWVAKALRPRQWAASYHGKVMPTEGARRLVTVREDVRISYPERVIPFDRARDLVLLRPDHIVALDCPCRSARKDPCLPLDVCLIVGEPFASFVLEHHADKARAISQDEAVEILEAEAARGHVHHAFFKEAMHNRFYAICNCCSCCCGAMSAQRNGIPMLISSGYLAQLDRERCQACGACERICPFGAITVQSEPKIDPEACMGCGVCVAHCPQGALSLAEDVTKPAPMELPL